MARLRRGISQVDLANEAEVAINYVSGIERGQENPTALMMHRLAKVLDISVAQLFAPVSSKDNLPNNLKPGPRPKPPRRRAKQ